MNTEDVVDSKLQEACEAGCTCVPDIWTSDPAGLFLQVRLVHESDCPLRTDR